MRELLNEDAPEVSYADLVLILSAVLSACATLRWRGPGIDKKRFVELLVSESPDDFHLSWISVPALIDLGYVAEADTPYGSGQSTRIFHDEEIDCPYLDARNKFPALTSSQAKQGSYAVLIYKWLRCGYAHEYCPHENITHVPPSRHKARISYISRSRGRGRGKLDGGLTRMISFHLDYLIDISEYHVSIAAQTGMQQPAEWWIDAT